MRSAFQLLLGLASMRVRGARQCAIITSFLTSGPASRKGSALCFTVSCLKGCHVRVGEGQSAG